MPFAAPTSFHQDLINQLNTFILTDEQRDIAEFLIGSIDDDGYLRRSVSDIVDDMAFTQGIYTDEKTVEKILHFIHDLEPSGVGARDLHECLLLQLRHKTPTEYVDLAIDIIQNNFDAFTKKHYEKLQSTYEISKEQLKKAIEEIEKLNPKPGGAFDSNNRTV
jgi:RNA polymerase sigma-54 factor